ncbi:copper amine oxidase N-terminal domain-containing protein [Paenibacillus pinihumi]|uniref:copper amine oxidase N-terminal domain-containing protein n=1 Tax=Paenibacillus pinihumi TaxID=669462 RepID=UPI000418B72E|nr:copper amine oxidase N-terminal domain-containing protein [Paenibacillus pinihumi]
MKRLLSALLGVSMLIMTVQPQAHAAPSSIRIYIDGSELQTDQGAVTINYRTLVPLRAIFEALDAKVTWNNNTQTVVARKNGVTVTLTIGSKIATIDDQTVYMDVAARTLNNRTLVPVRFVSEALGEEVKWDEASQNVFIKTSSKTYAPSNVSAAIAGQQGDGRDIEVSFSKAKDEANINQYRVYVVKSRNASSFTLGKAQSLSSSNYTAISKDGRDKRQTLSSNTRDSDGEYITSNQSYAVFVLAVGYGDQAALSQPSSTITLGSNQAAASNVKANITSTYGDGRDLSISFNRAQNENNVSNYRVFVVKTQDVNNFNATAASNVSSSNYTNVNKTGSNNLSANLNSSARDTSGEYLRTGVSYRAFVLAVTNNSNQQSSQLSTGSSVFSLGTSNTAPAVPSVTNVDNTNSYGDGRDLVVKFNRSTDESKVGSYRIFAVKNNQTGSFNLSTANDVKSNNYTTVNKNGSNQSVALNSGTRDVQGNVIKRGESYRFYVMAVGNSNAGFNNSLSSSSSQITVTTLPAVPTASNLRVSDDSDYGDGRDLTVSFNKSWNESNISHYRIIVVKASNANNFNLTSANNVPSSNYTTVYSTNASSQTTQLASSARDSSGDYIRSGVAYRVFVLSVSNNTYAATNSLSSSSSSITLTESNNLSAPSINKVEDISDYGDGRDLRVSFNRSSDESKVNLYRIFVVNTSNTSNFNLQSANSVAYGNYTEVYKNGSNQTITLNSSSRDTQGYTITTGRQYRVYVMAVGNERVNYQNALSSSSSTISLTTNAGSSAVTNVRAGDVSDYGDGRDLLVSFNKINDETRINHYRIMVVKSANADRFNLDQANNVPYANSTVVSKNGNNPSTILSSDARDVDGAAIRNGVSYKVFVLTVNDGSQAGSNALSAASATITLTNNSVSAPTSVSAASANTYGDTRDLEVTYNKPSSESNITEYRIMVVRSEQANSFNLLSANNVSSSNYTVASRQGNNPKTSLSRTARDVQGNAIVQNVSYQVFVLAVGDTRISSGNALSSSSNTITLTDLSAAPAAITNVQDSGNDGNGPSLSVSFNRSDSESNLAYYAVLVVPSGRSDSFKLSDANAIPASRYTQVSKTGGSNSVVLPSSTLDVDGNVLRSGVTYRVYVLSIADGRSVTVNALSTPSAEIVLN